VFAGLAVLLVAAVIAWLKVPSRTDRIQKTRRHVAWIQEAVQAYRIALGAYPATLEDLVVRKDRNVPGPFLSRGEILRDGWGQPFKYEVFDKAVRVTSPGPDGQFGTADDIGM
jgi:type II secretory pathway pseudopilin PulG